MTQDDSAAQESKLQPASGQEVGGSATVPVTGPSAAVAGRRAALRDLRRELSDDDLKSPGVQKMLLDELERADSECADLRGFRDRFYDRDKAAAMLEERLKPATAVEILFGVGVGLGGAIVGLAPLFWQDGAKGPICLGIGLVVILGSTVGRIARR